MRSTFLLFDVDRQRFALPVDAVERIVAASEVTPLAEPHPSVRGLVNVGGEVLPVVDLWPSADGAFSEIELSDRFILLGAGRRRAALLVRSVPGVVELDAESLHLPGGNLSRQVTVAFEDDEACVVLVRSVCDFLPDLDGAAEVLG